MSNASDKPRKLLNAILRNHAAPSDHTEGREEYTIDELAREAKSTVRNIRAYQDRGLLPPPEKRGRTGIYTDVHLARMRIISKLLDRGFTISNIKELLTGWENGRDLNDIFGLEVAVTSPWAKEAPSYIDYDELVEWFGDQITTDNINKAVKLHYLVPEADRLRIPSPRILNAGKELVDAGIPLSALLDEVLKVRGQVNEIASGFVHLVTTHLIDPKYGKEALPEGEDVASLADFIYRVRPIADMVVSAELARILDKAINDVVVDRLSSILNRNKEHSQPNSQES